MKLLALLDAPTCNTGFAKVGMNLIPRWMPHFKRIDIWGINYDGMPHTLPWRIYPGGFGDWNSTKRLADMLNLLRTGDYTHFWLLNDLVCFCGHAFAAALKAICAAKKIQTVLYYPVDAPLKPEWMEIVSAVDVAVTYTEYGLRETKRAWDEWEKRGKGEKEKGSESDSPLPPCSSAPLRPVAVIPHGVDTAVFHPLPDREALRAKNFPGLLPGDFLILNVNRQERRKAMVQSLQILIALQKLCPQEAFRLFLHCNPKNTREMTDLEIVGEQLGLPVRQVVAGAAWSHNAEVFERGVGQLPEAILNEMYNCADLTLTTSLGEGWGFSITEAAAAGCPVAVPDHTSCAEIADGFADRDMPGLILKMPISTNAVVHVNDNSRVRYPVDVDRASRFLAAELPYLRSVRCAPEPLNIPVQRWLSWDGIAATWLELFKHPTTQRPK